MSLLQVVFTACGTESDHHAIYGTVMAARQEWAQQAAEQGAVTSAARVPHVVASVIEHPAVLQYLSHLQGQGICSYALVPVNREGVVSAADVAAAVTPDTVLVTIMHSNNEVGSLQVGG
jgi:cysteine desulfurase